MRCRRMSRAGKIEAFSLNKDLKTLEDAEKDGKDLWVNVAVYNKKICKATNY